MNATADLARLSGSWRLLSVEATFTDTGERVATFGPDPQGRVVITQAGRIMFLITKSDRQSPANDADRASMFNQTIAYSGTVRFTNPGEFVTKVEMSLFPEEIGTEKLRRYKLDVDRLIVTRPEQTSRVTKGRLAVSTLTWQRET